MLRHSFTFLVAIAIAAPATSVSAATAALNMTMSGNNWTLTAQVSLGDNFGISRYSIPLAGGIQTLNHRTINSAFGNGPGGASGSIGFTAVRTANSSLNYVAAGMDATQANPPLIRGLGQEASNLATKGIIAFAPVNGDNPWAVPLVIATGTWAGTPPTIRINGDLGVGVFKEATGVSTEAATVDFPGLPPNVVLNALGERSRFGGVITASLQALGDVPHTWSNLTQTLGPPAGVAATIQGGNTFRWSPAFSQFGAKGSGTIKYQWTATATNYAGTDTDVAIEIILVPEPATFSLLGLAMVACVGVLRRRGIAAQTLVAKAQAKGPWERVPRPFLFLFVYGGVRARKEVRPQ